MYPIPAAHRKVIDTDPYFRLCARRREGTCDGRITIEHAFVYSGRRLNELWAYVPLCWRHHLGDLLDKQFNRYVALSRASPDDLKKYPRVDWQQLKEHLSKKYNL